MWVATYIFSAKKFRNICISLDVNFNESLTNDIVSFEQLGPEISEQFCYWELVRIKFGRKEEEVEEEEDDDEEEDTE